MIVVGDNPIRDPSEDRLGRAPLAASLARQIQQADASEGLVVGVLGPWGSGKTSFLNLVRHCLISEGVSVRDFNPWMFSGTEHLVRALFAELSAHFRFRRDVPNIGKMLDKYGKHLSVAPGVSQWAGTWSLLRRAWVCVSWLWRRSRPKRSPVEVTRDKIRKALIKRQEGPLIVILDDLDRLTIGEIRDIFRLVRLTASFPKIIYVLAFDRHQVEHALEQDGLAGRDYLEKIVQLVRDLPEVSRDELQDQLIVAIEESLSGIDDLGPFDNHTWSGVLIDVIMPLMKNLRDVRRYCASISGTVIDLDGEIRLPDVLALEAIRIFLPDVFAQLRGTVEIVTSSLESGIEAPASTEDTKQRVEQIAKSGGNQRAVVEALLRHVFPEGGRHLPDMDFITVMRSEWYQQRRVANTEIFRLYLERVEGRTLRMQRLGDQALSVMADAEELQSFMHSLEPESLRHVIVSLLTHESHFRPEHVVPGVTVLLNTWPRMPEHRGGFYDLDNQHIVAQVVLRLLRALGTADERSSTIDDILPQLETLSVQLKLITIGRYKDSAGQALVSVQDAERIERSFRDRVRGATADALAREHDLLSVMYRARKEASASEPELVVSSDPQVTRSMLVSAKQEIRTASEGGPVQYRIRLQWDALVEVYGDEAVLSKRIRELRTQRPENLDHLMELAEKYLSGWRPPDWPDD